MTARVLVLGLDAAEPTLLERWSDDGLLPTIAALRGRSYGGRLSGPMETLPGAIWPELQTGLSAGKVGQYYHPWQLHTGESTVRPIAPDEIDGEAYYWAVAARAGRRVCVVDQPQSVVVDGLPGALQLAEWGTHDRNLNGVSSPADLLDDVHRRFGRHPVRSCDAYGAGEHDRARLLADLEAGVAAKAELLSSLLDQARWDLFTATFTESHCGGHQLWALHDGSVNPGRGAPAGLRDGLLTVYRGIDAALGRLIEEAGRDCVTVVVASHGMGPVVGGPQLVHEVLFRLGLVGGSRTRRYLPPAARAWLRRRAPAVTGAVSRATGLQSPRTRAVSLDNNRCAAVRLNLIGREPSGTVRAEDAHELLAHIRAELLALRQPGSGEAIVAEARTAAEVFGADHHPDVPDLLVSFRTDLGPLDACESPTVGRVRAVFTPNSTRTGDHTPRSRMWLSGPGVIPGEATGGSVLDLAPTVLSLLALPLPPGLDGSPWPLAVSPRAALRAT